MFLRVIIITIGIIFSQKGLIYSNPLSFDPPINLKGFDTPNDAGESIGIKWDTALSDSTNDLFYKIYISEKDEGPFIELDIIPSNSHYTGDIDKPWWIWRGSRKEHFYEIKSSNKIKIISGRAYFIKVATADKDMAKESPVIKVIPEPNLFNLHLLNNFLFMVVFSIVLLYSISYAKKRPNIFLRKISGLDAVEEAIGRATEMGKPILYLTGTDGMDSLSTIAATVILGEVAKRAAVYETQIIVPHRDPIVMAVCQEIVKEAYIEAGRPDNYKEDSNFFITADQFSYTATVDGIMLRERPAANFFMGTYYAESLLLAETGASTGAIQIAGTDSDHQLPFFITACDYTLIGEELYAASAYLSREPVLLGTLRGQDIVKALLLSVLIFGSLIATIGELVDTKSYIYLFDIFRDIK